MTTETLNHEQAQEVFDFLIDKVDPEVAVCAYEAARYYGQTKISEIRNGSTIFVCFGYETLHDGCKVDGLLLRKDFRIAWEAVKSALQKAGFDS